MADESSNSYLDDVEAAKTRLELIQKWFNREKGSQNSSKSLHDQSNTEQSTIDLKYEKQLVIDIQNNENILNIAKRQNKINDSLPLTPKSEIVGIISTNDKLPFKSRREDNIDIALANNVLENQVEQSLDQVKHLKETDKELDDEISKQIQIQSDLEVVITLLQEKAQKINEQNEINDEQSEQGLLNQIGDEKIRYRALRAHLKRLIAKYEQE